MQINSKAVSVALLFASALAFASIPIDEIKGLDLTNEGFDDLNPLHGIPWFEGGILENHGEFLSVEDPLRQLILLLFHRTGTFDPSTLPDTNSVVPYLSPYQIGSLLGALKVGKLDDALERIPIPKGPKHKNARTAKNKMGRLLDQLNKDTRAYRVLLSLLWFKAQSKDNFAAYYEGVRDFSRDAASFVPSGWRKQQFTTVGATPPPITQYDAFLFWVMKRLSDAPMLERQQTAHSIAGSFANCGEVSLKNFLKLIIDDENGYNLNVLDALGATKAVKDFFTNFPTRKSQTLQKAQDAWANVTNNQEGIKYRQENPITHDRFELDTGASNMFALIHALIPGLADADDWPKMARLIEDARKKHGLGDFNFEEVDLVNDFGEVTFRVNSLGGFKWNFQPEHFYVRPLPSEILGEYPVKETLTDIAIFYPASELALQEDTTWYLYTRLRENEDIAIMLALLEHHKSLTLDTQIGLLNRLSTDDTQSRAFLDALKQSALKALITRKDFRPRDAYLSALAQNALFEEARILATHPFFKHSVYFFGHTNYVVWADFSPDGQNVVTVSKDETVRIWNSETGEELKVFRGLGQISSAVFSFDAQEILTTREDGIVQVWDARSGEELLVIRASGKLHTPAVFSPDGKKVLIASFDGAIRLWDAKTGEELHRHTVFFPNSALFSPDGKRLLIAGTTGARVLDAETGEDLMKFYQQTSILNSAAFSPDGQFVLTANDDKTARILDATTGEELMVFRGHTRPVKSAVFSPDGQYVMTVSLDKTIRIWEAKKGKELKAFHGNSYFTSAVFSPDGQRVLSASYDKTARIWKEIFQEPEEQ